MSQINRNNCNVSALRPLEVTCNPTNASSPETQDGAIQLYINGGTAPYTVSWTNGAQGTYIGNLQAGNYTATITDYYGDYTKTVTCTVGNNTFYLDEFIKCEDNFNANIYVFYDGTSLESTVASQASESIRSWYQGKKDDGFGGLLYEGVIGKEDNNSENWLWWATYPYLGSLTGGTLSDGVTEVKSFGLSGESVDYSIYNGNWCQGNDNGKCVPNNSSFNFSTDVAGSIDSDIYKRINNGFTLTGPYGSNDTRSNGVPFTVQSSTDNNFQTVYGDFVGGDTNYICIIVADESNGNVGFYHGDVSETSESTPDKDDLFNHPFTLTGTGWSATTQQEPSNRFTHDYESFLKVWEDIKSEGGKFEGYIYPLIENKVSEIPFIQHTVASVEGTTITESDFENKYGVDIDNVGPHNLNLSALTTTNVYTGMTGTTTYQNLDPSYKNGPGLKNFDWQVKPTVFTFEGGIIGSDLDDLFSDISLSTEKIYTTTIDNLVEDKIYKFSEVDGCYSYDQRLLSTGQEFSALTIINEYDECLTCQPSTPNPPFQPTLCFSDGEVQYQFNPNGMTNNYFIWENEENSLTLSYNTTLNRWEITPWANVGLGAMVREVNEQIPTGDYVNLGNTSPSIWTMTEGFCEDIPLTLTSQSTSETCDDSNDGGVILQGNGGTEPYEYRIQNVSPYPSYSILGVFSSLSPGNYLAEVRDNSLNTSSTVFNIAEGSNNTIYTVSLSSIVTNNGTGTRTWNYGVQVNPTLPANTEITFNIVLSHTQVYRDSGTANFSYNHQITKNGTINVPYLTSIPLTSTVTTNCSRSDVESTTKTFTNTATSIQFNGNDTSINGNVTQTVTINGSTAYCEPECRMLGTYNTSLQITNLSINGAQCESVTYAFTPIFENITIIDCNAQP